MKNEIKRQLDVLIPPEFVVVDLNVKDKSEAIQYLASLLKDSGYVKETYVDAVLTREEEFPTGLPTKDVPVALPHSDIEHCLKPGIAVGVLDSPVEFFEMATTDQIINAEIIFLLAITEPDQQVKWLSRLVSLFQTPGFLVKFKNANNAQEGHSILLKALKEEVVLEE